MESQSSFNLTVSDGWSCWTILKVFIDPLYFILWEVNWIILLFKFLEFILGGRNSLHPLAWILNLSIRPYTRLRHCVKESGRRIRMGWLGQEGLSEARTSTHPFLGGWLEWSMKGKGKVHWRYFWCPALLLLPWLLFQVQGLPWRQITM